MEFKKLVLLLVITFTSIASQAADRYWVASALGFSNWDNTANWSITSGGAGGASVPGVNDLVIFDGNGTGSCMININANILGIHLRAGYNSNVDQGAGIEVIVGSGDATFNDGIFSGNSNNITINGNFTIAGGSFNSTTAVLTITKNFAFTSGGFDEKTGTVRFNGGNQTFNGSLGFYNLEFLGSGNKDINPTSTFFVFNLFFYGGGASTININGGTINVYRDMLVGNTSPYNGGTGLIRFTGANDQNITSLSGTGRGELPNVEINKSGGTATFTGIVSTIRDWTYTSGNVDYTTNDATVALTGISQTLTGGETFNNLYITGSGTKTIASATTVSSLFTFGAASTIHINGDPINVTGDMLISNTSAYNNGSGLIRFTGVNNQTITSTSALGNGELPNVEIDKSGGIATFTGIVSTNKNWTYTSGNVDYTTNDATVALTGTNQTLTGSETFNNFYITGSGNKNIGSATTVSGLFTFASGNPININGAPINVIGDMLVSNNHHSNNGTGLIRITGANDQLIGSTAVVTRGELPNVEIDKSGGIAIFDGIVSTNKNWTYTSGNVDYTTNDATVALTGTTQTLTGSETFNNFYITGSGNKNIGSATTVSRLFTFASGSPININGAPINVIGDMLVSNNHHSNNGTGLIRITGANDQLIGSTATVTRGELPNVEIDKSGGIATFTGVVSTNKNWTYTSGNVDYTTNDATVALTRGGDQLLTGGETFNNLYFTGFGNKNIGSATTVSGLFTFASGNPININGAPINVIGDMLVSNTHSLNAGTGLIRITGTNDQLIESISADGRGRLPNIEINKSGGTATLKGILSTNGNWEYIDGNFDALSNATLVSVYSDKTIDGEALTNNMRFFDLKLNGSALRTFTGDVFVNNILFLNNGKMDLNGHALNIEAATPGAITRNNGYIYSETFDNESKINWNVNSSSSLFTFPFARGTSYIPVQFQVTDGQDVGMVSVSTYPTATDNTPFPTTPDTVTNLDNRSGISNVSNTIDRFWQIDKTGVSGTATISFTYANIEVQGPVVGKENLLQAHRYDKTTDTWVQPALPGQVQDVANNKVTVSGVTQFSPWALFFEANNPPVIKNDTVSVDEDNVLSVTAATSILLNDSDVDGVGAFDGLTVDALISGPTHALVFNWLPDGSFNYTPNTNYNGQDTIIFNVCDNAIPKLCAVDTVFITINPVNDFPSNSATNLMLAENPKNQIITFRTLNIVKDSQDPLGNVDPATVKIIDAPTNGIISIDPLTGIITYTPNQDFIGFDTYTYEACDDGNPLPSLCTQGIVSMTFIEDTDGDLRPDKWEIDANNDGIIDADFFTCTTILTDDLDFIPAAVDGNLSATLVHDAGFYSATITNTNPTTGTYNVGYPRYVDNLSNARILRSGGAGATTTIVFDSPSFNQQISIFGVNTNESQIVTFYYQGKKVILVPNITSSGTFLNDTIAHKGGAPASFSFITSIPIDSLIVTSIGIADEIFIDIDGDACVVLDSDGDGSFDHLDLDIDGDGIYNIEENNALNQPGVKDDNHDGMIDGSPADFGGNGLYTSIESDDGFNPTLTFTYPSTDADGILNYLDLDSDGDGIPDNIEGQPTATYVAPSGNDTDDNGVDDAYDTNGNWIDPVNTDNAADGADYVDTDSDDDAVDDNTEAAIPLLGLDGDGDGLDQIIDADNSGYNDPNGTIDDPSLLPDIDGDVLTGGDVDYRDNTDNRPDTDIDGIVDAIDIDDDNDGVSDIEECKKPRFDSGFGIATGNNDINWNVEWVDGPIGKQYAPVGIPGIIPAAVIGNLAPVPGGWIDAPAHSNAQWISHSFNAIIGGPGNHIDADMDGVIFERPNQGPPSGPTGDWVALNFSSTINLPVGAAATFYLNFDLAADNGTVGGNANGFAFPVEIYVNGVAQATALFDYNILTNVNLSTDWHDGDNLVEIKVYSGPNVGGMLIANTNSALDDCDTDHDGIPNHLDLDSDNDGIYDIVENGVLEEAGVTDDNNDGMIDGVPVDFGNNGLFNGIETDDSPAGLINYIVKDSDNDNIIDAQELDADADGCNDVLEAGFDDPDFDGQLGESPVAVDDFGLVSSGTGYTNPTETASGIYAFQDVNTFTACFLIAVDDPILVGSNTISVNGNVLDNDNANYTDILIVNTTPIVAPTNGTLVLNADGSFTYTPNTGFIGQDSFVYEVCDGLIPQQCDQATVTITITVLKISEGFSPNGDGINDHWFMQGINSYPLNKVKVFNRWGNMVYQVNGYNNIDKRWDGISTEGAFLGKKVVPEGTYFYVLDLGNGSKVMKGFITIKK